MTDVLFAGIRQPVRFLHCPMLLQQVRRFFHAWPHEVLSRPAGEPLIQVRAFGREAGSYDIRAPWIADSLREPATASALCSLAIELVAAFCEEHPQITCLHAAAVRLGNNTALLLGNNRAGKSTLVTGLMAHGQTCLGDDLVGVTEKGELLSFGIPPRLRLPLPPSGTLTEFVMKNKGIRDDLYQYVRAGHVLCAPFGQLSPLTHIIMLQRMSTGNAQLMRIGQSSGLIQLLPHYVMRKGSAETVLRQASRLTKETPVLLFRYADLDEAAAFLQSDLEISSAASQQSPGMQDFLPDFSLTAGRAGEGPLSPICYIQAPGARLRMEHGSAFLIDGASSTVYGLNSLGESIWSMLKQPLSEAEAAFLLREAFQEVDKGRIESDIIQLFSLLKERKLIVEHRTEG